MRHCYVPSIYRRFLLPLIAVLLSVVTLKAQTDINIGTGTVGNGNQTFPCPLQDWYEGSRAQYLYRATELVAAGMGPGNINSIKFNVTNMNGYAGDLQEYTVKIGGTALTTLAAGSWTNVPNTVFGPVNYVVTSGVNTLTFSAPYFWNGTDNIIIEICNGLPANVSDGIIHYTENPTIPWTTGLAFNGSRTYRADNEGNLCGYTGATENGTATTRPNITFNWTPASACTGSPNAGTATTTSNALFCAGIQFTLSLSGATVASGLTYQWQSSTDNVTFNNITGATAFNYTTTQTLPVVYYRCVVTCTNSGSFSNSTSVLVNNLSNPIYAPLPYIESFENAWINGCSTRDLPNSSWKNTPVTGNNSWRRNDDGTAAAWTTTNGAYTPPASLGNFSARFHSFNTPAGTSGTFDLYLNCSSGPATKRVVFDYINTSGADSLTVFLSTNGGTTFVRLDSLNTRTAWTEKTVPFTSTSATTILRFRGTGDNGATDIGIDNLRVTDFAPCVGTPTAGTATTNPANVCVGQTFTLNLTGSTDASGLTYQWQSSVTAGGPFTNITGATNISFSTTQTGSRYYRCIVTCTNGGATATSTEVLVTTNSLPGGTYTINSAAPTNWPGTPGGTNFNSFAAAIAATQCGIGGPVIFNVLPGANAGVYTEQVIINGLVPGMTVTNNITFQGNGHTIQFNSANTNERAVIKIKNSKHWVFDNLVVKADAGTFGFGFHLTSNADSNIIRNCTINTSLTSTTTNYCGVAISGSDGNAIGTGTTTALCDGNKIQNNTINGGMYGITLAATFSGGANGYNEFTGNKIRDFYQYGIYVTASYNTLISGNEISRPTRATVTEFQGIYFTAQSNACTISRNRIFNPFGAALANTGNFYGINFVTTSATATFDNIVVNNLIYASNGNGPQYGISNTGSSNVYYFHNTISLDSLNSNSSSLARGFNQTTTAAGILFYNNLINITRGGSGAKHCIYLGSGLLNFFDNNNYYMGSTLGTNSVGFLTSNRTTIANWKTAVAPQDAAALGTNPVFLSPSTGNYSPGNAAIDNKGLYLGVDDDITTTAAIRSTTTPDIGAYEFTPPPCTIPPVTGTTVLSAASICQGLPVLLNLNIGAFGSSQRFQWQFSTAPGGPWTNLGGQLLTPDTTILASQTYYYRCAVSCLTATEFTNEVLLTVTPALPAGTYTINNALGLTYVPGVPGGNFPSFNDAKAAMSCGVVGTGNIIFNVNNASGPYNEQLRLDSIRGVNVNRQIIFNGNGRTITFSSNSNGERAVIKLSGADYITFDSLTIDARGTGVYGYAVQLLNNADSNTFRRCTIISNTTSSSQNYAGVVINSTDAGVITTGNTWCDANAFDNNTITGGYYGVTLVGSATQIINDNKFTNNRIDEFYYYGMYLAGVNNTIITSNTFTRPTRTLVGPAYAIQLSSAICRSTLISKNRFTKFFGGAPTNTSGLYGVNINNVDPPAGSENEVSNNAFYNLDGNGVVYALYNTGSDNVNYHHNTISIDNPGATTSSAAAGFYQTTAATGINFKNNIVSITRGGGGLKHALYFASGTGSEITSNWNDLYIGLATTNAHTGYFTTNRTTLANWRAGAVNQDTSSFDFDPLYTDSANGNLRPQMLPLDNKGTPLGYTTDIVNATRSAVTPDIGAWEFVPPACAQPPVAGTAIVTPNTGVCLEVPIRLNLTGNSPIGQITFQWQHATSNSGPWTNLGPLLYGPQFDTVTSVRNYYRCIVTCNGVSSISTVTSVTLNAILLAGTYTIDGSLPQTWPGPPGSNFQTVQSAVNALQCGMTGSVVFNVKGTFNEQIRVPYIPGTNAGSTVTFQSYNGLPSGAELTFNSVGPNNYTLRLDSARYFFFRNMTFSATGTTLGRVIEFANTAAFDSIVGCVINAPVTTSTSNILAAVYANQLRGTNNVIRNNIINNGSSGINFSGTSAANPTDSHVIEGNTVSGFYQYGIYANFNSKIRISRNTVNVASPTFSSVWGIYATDCDSLYQITNNKVNINNALSTTYGVQLNNCDGSIVNPGRFTGNDIIAGTGNTGIQYGLYVNNSPFVNIWNNTIAVNTSAASSYGIYNNNSNNGVYYNNSVNSVASSATNNYAAYFLNTAVTSLTIRNNIFSHKNNGRALYIANTGLATCDYNMLYTNGAVLTQRATPTATNYANLNAWRNASFLDNNSIVYNPAFNSNTDLKPDITSPDVWAIHGRGVQIEGNNYDHENNTRPTTLIAGVPDLGAYEFYPTALPTVLLATPAVPVANGTQTFSYGTDTVMKLKWGATPPPSIEVRRYSGVVPTGLAAGGLDSMYFYTQVTIPGGGAYDYDAELFYIDPWLGSIPQPSQLGLGKTTAGNNWIVGYTSRNELSKKRIYQTAVNYLDKFTGLINPYAPPILPDRDSSNTGRRFWVAYGHHQSMTGTTGGAQDMVLYLGALEQAANVQVRVNGTSWVRNYTIAPNSAIQSDVMPKTGTDDARLLNEGLYTKGISITSDVPINAYAHTYNGATSGAGLLLPVGVWGYEYISLNSAQYYASDCYSWFYVIADNDNTLVEITPVVTTRGGRPAGVPFTITLNKGEAYQVMGTTSGATGTDMTGSKVKSIPNSSGKCFPVAVFSGSSRTAICNTTNGDNYMQQVFPSTAWGKRFLTFGTANSGSNTLYNSNKWRVLVQDPTTVVRRNGVVIPPATMITPGNYYEFGATNGNGASTSSYIETDKPALVAQYMLSTTGSGCAGLAAPSGNGDPEMFYISPIEQGIKKAVFYNTTNSAITSNYVNVIVPTAALASFRIDGSQTFTDVFDHPNLAGYKCIRQNLAAAAGQHIIVCDSPFTAITYGLGSVESYGYNAGTLVKNLKAGGVIRNTLNPTNPVEYTCANAPFRFTMSLAVVPTSITWKFSQVPNLNPGTDVTINNPSPTDSVIVNGEKIYLFTLATNFTFSAAGLYSVPVTFTAPTIGSCDNSQTDIIFVQVIPAPAIDLTYTFAGCEGNTANFNAGTSTPGGVNVNQWTWTFHNATTQTGQTSSFTYNTAGTFPVKLETITADGCLGDTTRSIVVNPRPVVDVVTDSITTCSGSTTAITFNILNPVTGTVYNWYNAATGGTLVHTGTSYSPPPATATTYYYVEGVSAFGCVSTVRKKVTLAIFQPLATPVVTVTGSTANSVTFSWAAVPGAGSYLVFVNGSTTGIAPNPGPLTHTVTGLTTLQNASIVVQAIGTITCQTSAASTAATGCANSSATVVPSIKDTCAGSNVSFNVVPAPAGITYTWFTQATGGTALTNGAAFTINATGSAFTANNVTNSTAYYVQQTNTATSCTGTVRTTATVNIAAPLAPLTFPAAAVTTPTSITFTWAAVAGATRYEVSTNGGTTWSTPSSGNTGLTHTISGLAPNTSVTLTVRATGNLGCLTSQGAQTAKTLIDAIYIPNAFNPNSNNTENRTLAVYGYVIKEIRFAVFNQWGEKLVEVNNPPVGANGRFSVWDGNAKGKQQPSGVYMYASRIVLFDGTVVEKKGSINLIR